MFKRIRNFFRIRKVIKYIIFEGTQHTLSGQYYIYFDYISNLFNFATREWILKNIERICIGLDKRKETLSETWIGYDENHESDSFDCNFCGKYCPYWEE